MAGVARPLRPCAVLQQPGRFQILAPVSIFWWYWTSFNHCCPLWVQRPSLRSGSILISGSEAYTALGYGWIPVLVVGRRHSWLRLALPSQVGVPLLEPVGGRSLRSGHHRGRSWLSLTPSYGPLAFVRHGRRGGANMAVGESQLLGVVTYRAPSALAIPILILFPQGSRAAGYWLALVYSGMRGLWLGQWYGLARGDSLRGYVAIGPRACQRLFDTRRPGPCWVNSVVASAPGRMICGSVPQFVPGLNL